MIRSLCFIHVMLALAMIGVGDMAGAALDSSAPDQLWLAALAFAALTAASATTAFILTKAGFHRFAGRH